MNRTLVKQGAIDVRHERSVPCDKDVVGLVARVPSVDSKATGDLAASLECLSVPPYDLL